MKRRTFLIGLATATLGVSGPLRAEDPAQAVIDRLRSEGFGNITTKRTFIGRVRITASKRGQSREVVVDPRNGEILRDLTRNTAADDDDGASASNSGSDGSGSGSGSDDGGSDDGNSGGDDGGSGGGGSDDGGSDDGGSDDGGSDHDGGDSGGDDGGDSGGDGNDD